MAMSKERQGEISRVRLKSLLRERMGFKDLLKEVSETATEIDIPANEAVEFVEIVVRELVDETFAKKPSTAGSPSPSTQ